MTRAARAPVLALALAGASLVAFALATLVHGMQISLPLAGVKNVFYRLYGLHEQPFFLLLTAFLIGVAIYLSPPRQPISSGLTATARPARLVFGLAIMVTGVTWLGFRGIMHAFPLSMDEFNSVFQSHIFASGHLAAPVPGPWSEWPGLITPGFVGYNPSSHEWASTYLPVYSALRAIAESLSFASLLNPLLAGGSVLAVAAVARRLWPASRSGPLLAAILLSSSSQFLFMSMTTYSMAAHLCANLVWLLLYLRAMERGVGWELLLLPWLGVLALGLHNPFPHALFAAPFLLRIARSKPKLVSIYIGGTYLLGVALYAIWWRLTMPVADQSHALALFGMPNSFDLLTQMMSLSLILSWQTPVLMLAVCLSTVMLKRPESMERDLAAGLGLTLAFYFVFRTSQGHGWGYRYFYSVLGSFVLLGVAGLRLMVEQYSRALIQRVVAASLILSVAVQLPIRAVQIERFVRPFAATSRMISSTGAAAVVIPTGLVWYGPDLIRNDPFLSGPVMVAASSDAAQEQRQWLGAHFGTSVRFLGPCDLAAEGMLLVEPTK
jgi:hypothetical protein